MVRCSISGASVLGPPKEQINSIKFVYPCGRLSSGYAFRTTDRRDKDSQESTVTRLSPIKVN